MKELMNTVKNVPAYAYEYPVWVVTNCDGELWFYGAWTMEDKNKANEIALREGREVLVR